MFEILLLFRCKGQINKAYLPSLLKNIPNSIQKKKKKKKKMVQRCWNYSYNDELLWVYRKLFLDFFKLIVG